MCLKSAVIKYGISPNLICLLVISSVDVERLRNNNISRYPIVIIINENIVIIKYFKQLLLITFFHN